MKAYLVRIFLCLLTCALVGGLAAARTIEFETTEVTAADVALSPDGQWLIFTMLGHLFRLPVEGGTAEQLTFGPYYDTDPVFSPDGPEGSGRVAFVSDRDGSEGNVFVLELATGEITQLTQEPWAARPAWTPDGQTIVYLRFERDVPGVVPMPWHSFEAGDTVPSVIRRVPLTGGEPETLRAPPQIIGSLFYLSENRLAWTVIEREHGSHNWTTRIEVRAPQGTVSVLATLKGYAAPLIPSPAGEGLYCRRFFPLPSWYTPPVDDLLFVSLPEGSEKLIFRLSRPHGAAPQFAVTADDKAVYLGEAGRLWKISLSDGVQEPIPFRARVRLEVQDPVPPPKWAPAAPGSSGPPRSVLSPRLSPDGRTLVFGAMGYLWQQPLDGSAEAQRLFAGSAFEWAPALSPDGRQLAFVHGEYGKEEVRVYDFESGQTRTLASGSGDLDDPSWSSDGQRLVYLDDDANRVVAVNLKDGKKEQLAETAWWQDARPHFSADGQSLYLSVHPTRTAIGTLYRLPLKEKAKPEPVTQLARYLSHALVSPDGNWLAFQRNTEIWVAPLAAEPIKEKDVRRLSLEGGDTFAFTPDGAAVIYSAGNRVWRHPLAGGEREEIPIRLELSRPVPPPVLLRRVRVLDFPPKAGPAGTSGGFGSETSLYIEQGRIRWIGSERGRRLPRETVILDADGRFAIPGLFDMHWHGAGGSQLQAAALAYGVTSVSEPAGRLSWLNTLADRGEASSDPVPRYFFSGTPFSSWPSHLQIFSEDDARTYVRLWKERGAHFLKVWYPLSWPLQRAIAEEARRQGLPIVGHAQKGFEVIIKNVTLGKARLEHTTTPGRFYDDMLQLLAAAGTYWDPTLVTRGTNLLMRDEPERLADPKLRAFTPAWQIRLAQTAAYNDGLRAIGENEFRGRWVVQLASVRAAHERGVKLTVGTGAGNPGISWGPHLHWELEFFVQAGIPPLDVLRIATQEGAAAVGAEDHLGTLEVGKLADIVLLDANPLEDIKNTQTTWRVFKGGWLFDPEKLRPPVSTSPDE
ncbi:MAG: LpqB family beta-propeller domain-containing protein [Candidatus Acidoferrales bacterium]